MRKILISLALFLGAMAIVVSPAFADSISINFENPPYTVGNINAQDGWTKTGSFDSAVTANTYGYASFNGQSLRISDAVTSGSFGDQTFAKPLVNAVGEIDSTDGTFSRGTLQRHFEMQFDIASTMQTVQPGMHLSVSPDRGDGSRMSYLRFEDGITGLDVFFDDVQGTSNPANFVETQIATGLSRTIPHTVKLTMDALDGPSNDVVKVYIDGTLVHTGTSWENYYRYDSESIAEPSPRITKTILFRESGIANNSDLNNGFLIDNLTTSSSTLSTPTITTPANGATVTSSALTMVDWTDSTGGTAPYQYQYEAYADAAYTSVIYQSGWLTDSFIPTPGTPPGDYYVRVRAMDGVGVITDWSNGNGAGNTYVIHVTADVTPTPIVGPPTNMDQCKNGGWQTFNNPSFRNQGLCVSYVVSHHH
jgi:hypothetical protein